VFVILSVVHVPVVEVGENAEVTPPGNPLTLNATLAEKPAPRVTATPKEVLAPWTIVREAGDAATAKSATVITSVAGTVRVRPPPVAVIVSW
jgi:hypothetical protein